MSARGHTVCPKCHPDLAGWKTKDWTGAESGVSDHAAEELGYDRSMREDYEFYILDGVKIVSEYAASCEACGFHFEIAHEDLIPGLRPPT